MKTIIAGSRDIVIPHPELVLNKAIKNSGFIITEVVSGTARGIDRLGEDWARNNNIPLKRFPANWEKYGRSAGYIRNSAMADYAEALIAIWDGESKGTKNMIHAAMHRNLNVFVEYM